MSATPQELRLPTNMENILANAADGSLYFSRDSAFPPPLELGEAFRIGYGLGLVAPAPGPDRPMLGFCRAIAWLRLDNPIPGVTRDLPRLLETLRIAAPLPRTLPHSIETASGDDLTLIGVGVGYTRASVVPDNEFRRVLLYTLEMLSLVAAAAAAAEGFSAVEEPGTPIVFPVAAPRVLWTESVHVTSHDPQLLTQLCGVAFDTAPQDRRYRWVLPYRLAGDAVIGAIRSERVSSLRFGPLRADRDAAVFTISMPMRVIFVATGRVV